MKFISKVNKNTKEKNIYNFFSLIFYDFVQKIYVIYIYIFKFKKSKNALFEIFAFYFSALQNVFNRILHSSPGFLEVFVKTVRIIKQFKPGRRFYSFKRHQHPSSTLSQAKLQKPLYAKRNTIGNGEKRNPIGF